MRTSLVCSLVCLLLTASSLAAQQPPSAAQSVGSQITLDVVVAPKSGRPISDLQESDFSVFDKKVPQRITSFKAVAGPQAPVELVLVIDAVNVNYMNLSYERQQIDQFLRANDGHLAHPTSIAILTDTGVQTQQAFSTDGNALSNALAQAEIGLRQIRRGAGFFGAEDRLQFCLNALHSLIAKEAPRPGRKVLLWISPGWPYLSGPGVYLDAKQQRQIFSDIVNTTDRLLQNRITIYSVDPLGSGQSVGWEFYYQDFLKSVTNPNQAQVGDLGLQVIALHSGGLALNASNDIAGQIKRCVADSAAYYELTFEAPPAEHRDEYHQLEVRVDKPGLTVRAPAGYYAEP